MCDLGRLKENVKSYFEKIESSEFKEEKWFINLRQRNENKSDDGRNVDYELYRAVLEDDFDQIKILLDRGATGDYIINAYGACALLAACQKGQLGIVSALLQDEVHTMVPQSVTLFSDFFSFPKSLHFFMKYL